MKNFLPQRSKRFMRTKCLDGQPKKGTVRVNTRPRRETVVKTETFHPGAQSALCAQSTLSELCALFARGHELR